MRAGKPWVDGGIDRLEGTARVFMPGENCYACNLGPEGLKEMKRRFSCANIIRRDEAAERVPTTPVIASVIGAVEAQEAMKLIHRAEMEEGELTSLCGRMFCYEGQHLTTRIVSFKAYDDDCPLHEQWTPVETAELTVQHSVGETLCLLAEMLHTNEVSFSLTTDCFVDWIVRRDNDQRFNVMQPGRQVARQYESLPTVGFYQHEYREIDKNFPYQELTLAQLGIPDEEVLWVHTGKADRYVQLKIGS